MKKTEQKKHAFSRGYRFLSYGVLFAFFLILFFIAVSFVVLKLSMGDPCADLDTHEAVSPEGRWIARSWEHACSGFGTGNAERYVALRPFGSSLFSMFHERTVFFRRITNETPEQDAIHIEWADNKNLKIVTAPCKGNGVTTGERERSQEDKKDCLLSSPAQGINISIAPPR